MTKTRTGSQAIISATSLSCHAPNNSIPRKIAERVQAVFIDIAPDTRWRFSVRGLAASMSRSIIRFRVIARPRAPTAAIRIHRISMPNFCEESSCMNWLCARTYPMKTKGREKSVCSTLTNERIFFISIKAPPYPSMRLL